MGQKENEAVELRHKLSEMKKTIERQAWNLAGCSTIADSGEPQKFSQKWALPALKSVNRMAQDLTAAYEQVLFLKKRLEELRRSRDAWRARAKGLAHRQKNAKSNSRTTAGGERA